VDCPLEKGRLTHKWFFNVTAGKKCIDIIVLLILKLLIFFGEKETFEKH